MMLFKEIVLKPKSTAFGKMWGNGGEIWGKLGLVTLSP